MIDVTPTSSDSPIVILTSLTKQFGRCAALRGISAEFLAGRLYVIGGDNGAGKTTLLRTIAGLSRPTRGTVSIQGHTDLRAVCGETNYMAHASLLYDELSGMENLRYFAQLYGIQDEHRCREAILQVNLDPALERPVGKYSQGMRQRMSLARALLSNPKILLLDEPFSNVDAHSAAEMVRLLQAMRDDGKTVLVATHQLSLFNGVADQFIGMKDGSIVFRTRTLLPESTQ